MTIDEAVRFAVEELIAAEQTHHAFNSGHEGYAVIREEVDELWDAVKASKGYLTYGGDAAYEAVQVAAMGLRFLVNLCDVDSLRAYLDGRRAER